MQRDKLTILASDMDVCTYSFASRLKSFYNIRRRGNIKFYVRKFPNAKVKFFDLAKAGYIYEGDGDIVRCCMCKIRIMDLMVGDDPCLLYTSRCV